MTALKNVASWKLNAAERKEVEDRVKCGENELTVKRELQQKKAQACADSKAAAAAVAAKCQLQSTQAAKAKAKAKAKNKAAAAPVSAESNLKEQELNDAANKAYYCQVLEDCEVVLSHFGEDFRKESPLAITGAADTTSGVQEPYSRSKCQTALKAHGCYRASISVWWINPVASPTPGVPLARRRVEDLSEYYYGASGEPQFHSDRMLEVGVARSDCDTDFPSGLQIVSPEEVLHATLCGCARAVKFRGVERCLCI